jgi:hypothetical protein
MGCGSSTPQPATPAGGGANSGYEAPRRPAADDPKEIVKSGGIDRELDRARQQEEGKVKLLLLGSGESGKSTIFKQMRILYGSPRSEDDLRFYGVVIRSNVIVAIRKLCTHLRNLELESALAEEPAPDGEIMTPKQAHDELVAHLVDNTAVISEGGENGAIDPKDWVGTSPRAGLGLNNDAKQFLQHVKAIGILWQVSQNYSFCKSFFCVALTNFFFAILRLLHSQKQCEKSGQNERQSTLLTDTRNTYRNWLELQTLPSSPQCKIFF